MRHLLTVSVILKKWQQRLPRNKATGTDLWICFKKAQAEISGSNHYKWSAVVHDAATSEPSLENRYFIFHWTKWWCILKARLNTSESRLLSEGILIAKFRTSSKTEFARKKIKKALSEIRPFQKSRLRTPTIANHAWKRWTTLSEIHPECFLQGAGNESSGVFPVLR